METTTNGGDEMNTETTDTERQDFANTMWDAMEAGFMTMAEFDEAMTWYDEN